MLSNFKLIRKLGDDRYSSVGLYADKSTGLQYAIKSIGRSFLSQSGANGKRAYDWLLRDMDVMKRRSNADNRRLRSIIDEPEDKDVHIVTKYFANGSLETTIQSTKGVAPEQARKYLQEIL